MERIKRILAWIILIVSLLIVSYLTYLKFFYVKEEIDYYPVNSSSNQAIKTALNNIKDNIELDNVKLNNYSLYISYNNKTYEFYYHNLYLSSASTGSSDFKEVLAYLLVSINKRLNNDITLDDAKKCIENKCNSFNIRKDGNNTIYDVNIMTKLEKEE